MRKLNYLLIALTIFISACENGFHDEDKNQISLSTKTIEVDFESDEHAIKVTSLYSWIAESKNDWISLTCDNGIAGTEELKFVCDRNLEESERKGTIVIKNEDFGLATELYVTQKSFIPELVVEQDKTLSFTEKGGSEIIKVSSNFSYDVSYNASWISCYKVEEGIKVSASASDGVNERTAKITIYSEKYNLSYEVNASQNGWSIESPNKIVYTTMYGNKIQPYKTDGFGAKIVAHIYQENRGVIIFDSTITSIGNSAFSGCVNLTNIIIPESVTSIGEQAFYGCQNLISFTIPPQVQYVGDNAFYDCLSLKGFYGKYASQHNNCLIINDVFYNFAIASDESSFTIPDNVIQIKDYAFRNCTTLTSITIPNSVSSIGCNVFQNCIGNLVINNKMLVESDYSKNDYPYHSDYYNNGWLNGAKFSKITIGDNIQKIGNYVFYWCTTLENIVIPESVSSIGEYTFCNCSNLKNINIPHGIKSIREGTFNHCSSLVNITIPNNITSIGEFAFNGCSSLTKVTIPNSVISIGKQAFRYCTGELNINCNISNSSSYSDSPFFDSDFTKVVVGRDVDSFGYYAFNDCTKLGMVDVVDLSTWCKINFGNETSNPLYYARKLYINGLEATDIIIPSDIISINSLAFYRCTTLNSVKIPESVSIIGSYAFGCCTSLKSVIIGRGVTSIKKRAFEYCNSLRDVYCKPIDPPELYYASGDDIFLSHNSEMKIYVPYNSYESYTRYTSIGTSTSRDNWFVYKSYIEPYDFE